MDKNKALGTKGRGDKERGEGEGEPHLKQPQRNLEKGAAKLISLRQHTDLWAEYPSSENLDSQVL